MQILYRKTYKNCSELPALRFFKIVTKNDLNQLLCDRDGWRLKPDLQSVWDDIFMEYTELSQDKQGSVIFGLIKDLTVLKNKIDNIQLCIEILSKTTDLSTKQPTINALKSMAGVNFSFSPETIGKDLIGTVNASKRFLIEYEELMLEYKKLAHTEQAKATEMDYMEQVAFLKEHFSFDTEKISTMEYIAMINNIKNRK